MAGHGIENGNQKLTDDQVIQMRTERAAGDTIPELALRYGVSYANVSYIVRGLAWAHVGGPRSAPGVSPRGLRIRGNRRRTD